MPTVTFPRLPAAAKLSLRPRTNLGKRDKPLPVASDWTAAAAAAVTKTTTPGEAAAAAAAEKAKLSWDDVSVGPSLSHVSGPPEWPYLFQSERDELEIRCWDHL